MTLPSYKTHRPCSAGCTNAVPSHWSDLVIKRIAHLKSGESIDPDEIQPEGKYAVYGGNGIRGFTSSFTHEGHFPLIGRQGALCGNINYAKGRFWASEHAVVARPIQEVNVIWLGELLRAMNLNQYSVSAAQPGLSVETISDLRIPLPPREEQDAIANFLIREGKSIQGLIAGQEKLIALLQEKRQAVISHAVTKGLNPSAPMKPSGIEYLGSLPTHWTRGVLARIARRVVVGIAEATTHAYVEDGIPILRSTNIRPGAIIGEILRIDEAFAQDRGSKLIAVGDLVTVRTGNPGVTVVVPPELGGCHCFTMLVTTLDSGYSPRFFCYWMNSLASQSYFAIEGWGSAQRNISVPILKALPIPIPPRAEQEEIVSYLDEAASKFDALIYAAERAVALLIERRAALISFAVTGQIDVRELDPAVVA